MLIIFYLYTFFANLYSALNIHMNKIYQAMMTVCIHVLVCMNKNWKILKTCMKRVLLIFHDDAYVYFL